MKIRWRRWAVVFSVLAALMVVCYLARGAILPPVAAWLDVGEPPEPADAVMLLNGSESTRAFAAAALVTGGWAPRVLLSTVKASPQVEEGIVLPRHEINRRLLRHCGVADGAIVLLDGDAATTFDEAAALAAWLDGRPDMRLLVVTDGPHTRRARWVFRRVLGARAGQLTMVSAPVDDFQVELWWRSKDGLEFIVSEYLKLAFYGVRYGWLGYEVAAACAVLLLLWFYWRHLSARRRNQGLGRGASR